MGRFAEIDKFHQTRKGKVAFGVAELLVAYLAVSRAIDTGSLWQYLIFILLVIGGIHNLIRAVLPKGVNAKSRAKNG